MSKPEKEVTPEQFWKGIEELRELQKETDRQMKETDRQMKETDRKIEKLYQSLSKTNGRFNNRWGRFVEKLVEGGLVALLKNWNIRVTRIHTRLIYSFPGQPRIPRGEFDLVALNGEEIVVVEIKSSLEKKDVDRFIVKLREFREIFHEHREKSIYGGVAYLEPIKKAHDYAKEQGLFAIGALEGNSGISVITNDPKSFRPKSF